MKFLLNIDVDRAEQVDRLVPLAVAKGATLIKEPCKTYYHCELKLI